MPTEGDLKPLGLTALLSPTLPLLGFSISSPASAPTPKALRRGAVGHTQHILHPKATVPASPLSPYPGSSLWIGCIHSCP